MITGISYMYKGLSGTVKLVKPGHKTAEKTAEKKKTSASKKSASAKKTPAKKAANKKADPSATATAKA